MNEKEENSENRLRAPSNSTILAQLGNRTEEGRKASRC